MSKSIFTFQNFIAELGKDGRRLGRSYLYEVTFWFNKISPDLKSHIPLDEELNKKLTFFCTDAMIPGWRANTEQASIYGLPYEVVTNIQQDPLWISFNADILHRIPHTFMSGLKDSSQPFSIFGQGINSPLVPKYKSEYQFNIDITILDEANDYVAKYEFINSFIKTVQLIQLGVDNKAVPKVTVEIIYERVKTNLETDHSRPTIKEGPVVSKMPISETGFESHTS